MLKEVKNYKARFIFTIQKCNSLCIQGYQNNFKNKIDQYTFFCEELNFSSHLQVTKRQC